MAAEPHHRQHGGAVEPLRSLDQVGDPGLAGLTRVAAFVTGAHAAAVHIIDDAYQHRVAAVNAELGEVPREDAMCSLAVDTGSTVICEDASADARFAYSSFVRGDAPVRFYVSVPLFTSEGIAIGTLCAFDIVPRSIEHDQLTALEDLAAQVVGHVELARLANDLGDAASHDPLTGVANRLVLGDRLEQALARRRRRGGNVVVVIIDLDDFKTLNLRHGHAAGDAALVEVADRLRHSARVEDTIARIGGDEFVLLAEDLVDPESVHSLLTRLEDTVGRPITVAGADWPLHVSVGYAFAAMGDDPTGLMARADASMYATKHLG